MCSIAFGFTIPFESLVLTIGSNILMRYVVMLVALGSARKAAQDILSQHQGCAADCKDRFECHIVEVDDAKVGGLPEFLIPIFVQILPISQNFTYF